MCISNSMSVCVYVIRMPVSPSSFNNKRSFIIAKLFTIKLKRLIF